MSLSYSTNVDANELIEFLLDEHRIGTGIPVHPFSVVNATLTEYNGTYGITDGNGTLFVSNEHMDAYGCNNNHDAMMKALRRCDVSFDFIW